jgi:hypothetical protein
MIKNVEEESDLKFQEHPSRVFQISLGQALNEDRTRFKGQCILVSNFLLFDYESTVIKNVGNISDLNNDYFQEYPSRV